jgi:hypothetical protein
MEPTLQLTPSDQTAVQEATLQDFHTQGWKTIEAALFIAGTTYVYKRRIPHSHPPTFEYKCLSPESLQRAFHLEQVDTGWIDPGVVRCGSSTVGNWAVLHIPPDRHTLELKDSSQSKSVSLPLPGFVMLGIEDKYWLWAVTGNRFDPTALAHQAPLPNVYNTGVICWGNNTPPTASAQTMSQAWTRFITTPFNDHLVQGKSRKHSIDVTQQLLTLSRGKRKAYPTNDLVPHQSGYRSSISDLIEEKIQ